MRIGHISFPNSLGSSRGRGFNRHLLSKLSKSCSGERDSRLELQSRLGWSVLLAGYFCCAAVAIIIIVIFFFLQEFPLRFFYVRHPPGFEANHPPKGKLVKLCTYYKKINYAPAVRSKISSKLIFASYVCCSDRAYYWVCVLNKDIGRRLPLELQSV